MVDANLLHTLVEFLDGKCEDRLRCEACWCLTNVATGNADHVQALAEKGSVPALVNLLKEECKELREQALWTIGNIAYEGAEYADLVLNCNLESALGGVIERLNDLHGAKIAFWALANTIRSASKLPLEFIEKVMPYLTHAICVYEDNEILKDACWSLVYVVENCKEEQCDLFLKLAVIPKLIKLISYSSSLYL